VAAPAGVSSVPESVDLSVALFFPKQRGKLGGSRRRGGASRLIPGPDECRGPFSVGACARAPPARDGPRLNWRDGEPRRELGIRPWKVKGSISPRLSLELQEQRRPAGPSAKFRSSIVRRYSDGECRRLPRDGRRAPEVERFWICSLIASTWRNYFHLVSQRPREQFNGSFVQSELPFFIYSNVITYYAEPWYSSGNLMPYNYLPKELRSRIMLAFSALSKPSRASNYSTLF
jgi:hypothetical protein